MFSGSAVKWIVYQQDYLWFLVAVGWMAMALAWRRYAADRQSYKWVPWAAGAGIATALVEVAHMLTPAESRPWFTPWLPWEIALGTLLSLWAAGWWWELAIRNGAGWTRRAASGIVVLVCASAAWRLVYSEIGAWVEAGLLSSAAIGFAFRSEIGRAERVSLAAASLSAWLGTTGPVAERLGEPQHSDISSFGPWAALCQVAALVALGIAISGQVRVDSEDGDATENDRRQLVRSVGLWLVAGLLLASGMGRWARASYERSLRSRAVLSAALIDTKGLEGVLGPRFRLNRIRDWRTASGRKAQIYRSDYWGTGVLDTFAVTLTSIELANPDVRWAQILTMRDGRLVIACNATRMAGYLSINGIFGRPEPEVWQQWTERRIEVLGPIDFYYGDVVQARAPLIAPNGRMLGWLALDVGVAEWVAAQAQARLLAFAVVALGGALLVLNWRQRQRQRQREAARREAATAAAANQLKSAFLAKVSHELRTPIQSLLGYSELLRLRVADDPKAAAWLGSLRQQGELMTRLVNDLIDLGAVEAGAFQLAPKVVAPADVVMQTMESFRPRAEAKGLSLACFVDPSVPAWVRADGERLRQVVTNLLGNAIKFTDRGGVTVALRAEERETGDGRQEKGKPPAAGTRGLSPGTCLLKLTVRDTGPGIPPAEQGRLFAPFSRLEATAGKEGSGLGLALSAALCRAMGGELTVESDGLSGSLFTATFRAQPAAAPATASAERRTAVLRGHRVLVVDDNPLVRELFVAFLTEQGALCAASGSGAEALAQAAASAFDTAVLDLALPDLDGAEVARRLRAGSAPGRALRLVGVSAHAGAADRARALAAGMDIFLTKPVGLGDLASAVAGATGAGDGAALPFHTGEALRTRLTRQFRGEAPRHRAELATAVTARDWPRVRTLAHYLKNSAVVVRDEALFTACTGLEQAAEATDEPTLLPRWTRCAHALDRWSASPAAPLYSVVAETNGTPNQHKISPPPPCPH